MPVPGTIKMAVTKTASGPAAATAQPVVPWTPVNPDIDKLLFPASKVVPFLGAGVSGGAGFPTGADICQRLRDDFGVTDATSFKDPRIIATIIVEKQLGSDRDVQSSVAKLCQETQAQFRRTPALDAIAGVPSKWVITLSYDDAVEQTAKALGITSKPYTWKRLPPWEDAASGTDHVLNVLHIHGRWQDADSIILDEATYGYVENNDRLKMFVGSLLLHHNVCFVGTSFDEAYLVKLFAALPTNEPKHVFFCQDLEVVPTQRSRLAFNEPVHNVIYEPFPENDWAHLGRLCQHYFTPVARDYAALAASDFIVPSPVPRYLPPTLVVRPASDGQSAQSFFWSVELGHEEPVSAEALAVKTRALIIGRPGAGKSQLLRRAAAEMPSDEHAVLIRLAGAADPIGDPVAVLIGWARANQPQDCEHELTEADLEHQRFHFLLDGLDEVPAARQPRLAERIAEMARALPQHRFTITSRPIPAADLLETSEWERLELTTTSDWRNEYLAVSNIKREDLLARVPALGDLDDLLNLPFFLAAVVELFQDDALPEHGDVMTVTQALFDRALSATDIAPVRKAVRPWLRDVAFAMQVMGHNELDVDELNRIALPAGLNLGPDEDVLDLLSRRSLLERTGGRVRFVHRLIADTLVAEKLIELGPTRSGLLNVIAPVSDLVSGVRSDWMVVLVLAGARSHAWRTAVAERDTLAAARMVPPTAELSERRDAALMLWRTYLTSRVWMHSFESPRLLQDAETMGRLLRPRDLPDVVDEVLGGTHHSSPQVRSNAIEVLAYAQLDDELSPVVRAALAGEETEEVVRRQAAGAARHRMVTSAFPLVRRLALESSDKLEIQGMVAVSLRLAPADSLLEFALELIESGRGKHWAVESIVRERAGADAALVVMCKQAERGELSHHNKRELVKLLADLPDDDATTEQLGFIVATGADSAQLMARFVSRPEAAIRGLVAGLSSRPRNWFEVARLVSVLPDELVDAAEFSHEHEWIRERFKQLRPSSGTTPASTDAAVVVDDVDAAEEEDAAGPEPTLADLLDRDDADADWLIVRNAAYFAVAVEGLDARRRRSLQGRVRSWWPERGFAASITGNRIEWNVHACLAYGSQLKPALSDDQWVDIAHIGMPYEGKDDWLRTRYRRGGALKAAQIWPNADAKTWSQLAESIPGKLPLELVRAMVDRIKTADSYIESLLARLLSERRIPALRKLAAVAGAVGDAALYYVAQSGDFKAQRKCLTALIKQFGTSESIHSDDLGWMQGVTDARLLPDLFEALVKTQHHRNPDRFNDTMGPIHMAIRRIGGVAAVNAYDELIAREPLAFDGVHFERHQRDNILDDILLALGDEARDALLADLGLPVLNAPEQETSDRVARRRRVAYTVVDPS